MNLAKGKKKTTTKPPELTQEQLFELQKIHTQGMYDVLGALPWKNIVLSGLFTAAWMKAYGNSFTFGDLALGITYGFTIPDALRGGLFANLYAGGAMAVLGAGFFDFDETIDEDGNVNWEDMPDNAPFKKMMLRRKNECEAKGGTFDTSKDPWCDMTAVYKQKCLDRGEPWYWDEEIKLCRRPNGYP